MSKQSSPSNEARRVLLTYEVPVLVTVNLETGEVDEVQIAKENSVLDATKGAVRPDDLEEVPAKLAARAIAIADEGDWPAGLYV